ncbi:hypothetical protein C8R43DRAFT_1139625 [Mycena crocata]|nr:hypothetical protein C8R43DRAFT_1139625 [Mycena crocata]
MTSCDSFLHAPLARYPLRFHLRQPYQPFFDFMPEETDHRTVGGNTFDPAGVDTLEAVGDQEHFAPCPPYLGGPNFAFDFRLSVAGELAATPGGVTGGELASSAFHPGADRLASESAPHLFVPMCSPSACTGVYAGQTVGLDRVIDEEVGQGHNLSQASQPLPRPWTAAGHRGDLVVIPLSASDDLDTDELHRPIKRRKIVVQDLTVSPSALAAPTQSSSPSVHP